MWKREKDMDFPDRSKIIRQIEVSYRKQGSGILVVYGERGLGKTTLLLEIAERFPSVYYHAVPASEPQQTELFIRQLGGVLQRPAADCRDAFFCLADRCRQQKTILILDEFDYILRAGDQFPEQLRLFLNHGYSDTDFLVILSSSSLGFIAHSLGKKMGPCLPYIQGILKMRELSFSNASLMMPGLAVQDRFAAYALLGGNPMCLAAAGGYRGARQIACEMFLKETGMLFGYGILRSGDQLREMNIYATILYTIASGKTKLNDIHLATGFGRAKISVYLKNLMELDLVEKVYSYGAGPRDDSRKGMYRISHPSAAFWYSFIYGNMSALPRMSAAQFYDDWIGGRIRDFMERAYVKVAAQALCEGRIEGLPKIVRCEEWQGKSGEIPIVAITQDGAAIPVFVRYESALISSQDIEWYAFSCQKAKLNADDMVIFSENRQDFVHKEKKRMYSLFASLS